MDSRPGTLSGTIHRLGGAPSGAPDGQARGEISRTQASAARRRIAYLASEYPKTSHTFIRREVLELERLGFDVVRLSIRHPDAPLVDPADVAEDKKTVYCLDLPKSRLLTAMLRSMGRPVAFAKALSLCLRVARTSDRGVLKHLAYLVEAAALTRVLRERGVGHVHVHFATNAADVALLMRALGGPRYSLMVHGPEEFERARNISLKEKVEGSRFTAAISNYAKGQICQAVDYDCWGKVHVVHCTVGDSFPADSPPVEEGCKTFVCVGRLTRQKAHLLLLDAAADLAAAGEDFRLVLAGDGELRPPIERRIDELKLRPYVTITGWIGEKQVRQHLLDSRALVLPSFAEGLPVVIMEALALGRPVISTAVAGIPELLEDGRSGWLIPTGSRDALVNAMRDALHAPAARLNEMGAHGRDKVRRQHDTRTEVARLAGLFEKYAVDATEPGENRPRT